MGILDFLNNNLGLISGGLGLIGDIGAVNSKNDSLNNYLDIAKQENQNAYDQGKQNYDSYVSYLQNQFKNQQAAAGARAANARMRAAYLAKQDKARMGALQTSINTQNDSLGKSLGMLQPFIDAGKQVMPNAIKNYNQGSSGAQMLLAYLQSPEIMKRLNQSVPAYNVAPSLPSYLRK